MARKILIRFWISPDGRDDAQKEFADLCAAFPDAKTLLETRLEKLARSAANGDLSGQHPVFSWVELLYVFMMKASSSDADRKFLEQLWSLLQKIAGISGKNTGALEVTFRKHSQIGSAWSSFLQRLRQDASIFSRWKLLLRMLAERVPPEESWRSEIAFVSHGFEYLAEISFDVERKDDCTIVTIWRVRQM